MASGDYYLPQQWVTTASGSSNTYLWNGGYSIASGIASGGGYGGSGGGTPPPLRAPTALEWLDGEVEKVCKLARMAA